MDSGLVNTSNRNKRSDVWNFFTPINAQVARCSVCKQPCSYKTTISNLRRHMRRKHPNNDVNITELEKGESDSEISEITEDEVMLEEQETKILNTGNCRRTIYISPKKHSSPIVKARTSNPLVKEVYVMMKSMQSRMEEKDEYALLGEQIAMRIKKLPTQHARYMVQQMINTNLYEAETGKYDNPQRSKYET